MAWYSQLLAYCMVVLASYDLGRCIIMFLTRLAARPWIIMQLFVAVILMVAVSLGVPGISIPMG